MLKSMTAFGRARRTAASGDRDITAEIKSVNSRYLDCTVKTPRGYSFLEERVKSYLTSRGIVRGKIEVYIGIDVIRQTGTEVGHKRALRAPRYVFPSRRHHGHEGRGKPRDIHRDPRRG